MSRKAVPSASLSLCFPLEELSKVALDSKISVRYPSPPSLHSFRRRRTRRPPPPPPKPQDDDAMLKKKKKKQSVLILLLLCKKLLLHLLLQKEKEKSVAFMPQHNDYEKKN